MKTLDTHRDLVIAYLLAQAGLTLPDDESTEAVPRESAAVPVVQPGSLPVRWH
jgi:hypothetical protein